MNYRSLDREELIALLEEQERESVGGIRLTYKGQTPPWQIIRRVQPRGQRIVKKLCEGDEAQQTANLIVEGENLQAMVSLYKYRGQVDMILTDPPYNTGRDFRYNDRWEEDPNDPELGALVPADDGSRHSKWLRFMTPRVWMLREILKPGGVLAICIDQHELFRLGMLLDEVFGEGNRLAIINWQRTGTKNNLRHVASTTEYVLAYGKNIERVSTRLLDRSKKADARFGNPDNDPHDWKQDNATGPSAVTHPTMVYAIQTPFTGELHYPTEGRCWGYEKKRMKAWLEEWGAKYAERDLGDGLSKALVIRGGAIAGDDGFSPDCPVLKKAQKAAEKIQATGPWPRLYFGHKGTSKPMMKVYEGEVKAGSVPTTFWAEPEEEPLELDAVSWASSESGRSREGVEELKRIVGKDHGFETVKPLKLFTKIIQLWCPQDGIVVDPFAGSGTTAHAVLELNQRDGGSRRFILVEQGRSERGDPYARGLTVDRVKRVITGKWADNGHDPLGGGFRFVKLLDRIDADAVLALEREEMLDLLLTTHWDQSERSGAHLRRLPAGSCEHLFAVNSKEAGYFLVWNGPNKPAVLNRAAFRAIAKEAKEASLKPPYHVYARICTYTGPNIEFYQIPDRILEKLGFNEAMDPFRNGGKGNEQKT